jgi:hypothetical protein
MVESREVKYILRFNRYYIFWEDYGEPYADKAEAERELARLKTEKPPYWNWRLVERETIVRERDVG